MFVCLIVGQVYLSSSSERQLLSHMKAKILFVCRPIRAPSPSTCPLPRTAQHLTATQTSHLGRQLNVAVIKPPPPPRRASSPPWPCINNKVAIMRTVQRVQRFPAYCQTARMRVASIKPANNQSIHQSIKRAKASQAAAATASRLPILTFVLFLDTCDSLHCSAIRLNL